MASSILGDPMVLSIPTAPSALTAPNLMSSCAPTTLGMISSCASTNRIGLVMVSKSLSLEKTVIESKKEIPGSGG